LFKYISPLEVKKKVIAVFESHADAVFSLLGKFHLLQTQLLLLTEGAEVLNNRDQARRIIDTIN
jgi:hypothetical protein